MEMDSCMSADEFERELDSICFDGDCVACGQTFCEWRSKVKQALDSCLDSADFERELNSICFRGDENKQRIGDKTNQVRKDAAWLMNSANLLPPNNLFAQETTLFDINDDLFKTVETKNLKYAFLPNAGEQGSTSSHPLMDLEQDLFLSSDTDPYATDHDSDDPDFDINEASNKCKTKRKPRAINVALSSDSDDEESNETENYSRKKKGKLNPWRRSVIKSARNQGKEYINWKGKLQPAREIKQPCMNCRMNCSQKISNEERSVIFQDYWNLGDVNRQRDFIAKYITVADKSRTRKRKREQAISEEAAESEDEPLEENRSRRNFSITYSLPTARNKEKVCKTFFLNTLSISGQVVKTVLNKTGSTGMVSEDRRGKVCKNSLVPEVVKQTVREHINSFQTVGSHYCRQNSSRKYLPPTLNVSKMFSLYLDHCRDNNIAEAASEAMYRLIFTSEFNLSFFQPKKDLCDICHKYDHSSQAEKLLLDKEYRDHIKNKTLAREAKNIDKQKASDNPNEICCAVFDLQQILPVPKSNVGVSYYKLKLSAYNFTIFNLATKQCSCYMWHEVIAKRGASEIGSCLLLYITDQVQKGIKYFLFYSDNCAGQNRNRFLYCLYNYASQKYQITIRHTYLEKGHTQSEGDSVHSVIERAARHVPIYTPEQWYTIVGTAKRKDPYKVIELSQENIFDLKDLEKNMCLNWDKDQDNEKVYLSKLRIVETNPDFPNMLLFKLNYEDPSYKKINITQKGRKKRDIKIDEINLKQCYDEKIALSKKKYDHLQFICQKSAITSPYHDYFKNLPFSETSVNSDDE